MAEVQGAADPLSRAGRNWIDSKRRNISQKSWIRVNFSDLSLFAYPGNESCTLPTTTNPVTIPPMFYFAYLVGAWVLGREVAPFDLEFWAQPANWATILSPLALGCLLCAIACSVLGYFGVRLAWRWHVARHLQRRRARRQASAAPGPAAAAGLRDPSSSRQI